MNVKDPSSRLMRWRLKLEEYEYKIIYKKGTKNSNADALSRIYPINASSTSDALEEESSSEITDSEIEELAENMSVTRRLQLSEESTFEDFLQDIQDPSSTMIIEEKLPRPSQPRILVTFDSTNGDLQKERTHWKLPPLKQSEHGVMRNTYNLFLNIKLDMLEKQLNTILIALPSMNAQKTRLIKRMLIYVFEESGITPYVMPESSINPNEDHKRILIKEAHNCITGGHLGIHKTLEKIRTRHEWPNLRKEVEDHIKNCASCQKNKLVRIKPHQEMLITDTPTKPNQKIAIDIVGPLTETPNGNRYLLTVQDYLTKYLTIIPLKRTLACDIANALVNEYFFIYGTPEEILSDNGNNIAGKLITELERMFKIKPLRTTACRPQSNGSLERAHHTIIEYLKHYVNQQGNDWDKYVKLANLTYNTSKHEATGFTPFELLFGREAHLPSSIAYPQSGVTGEEYLNELRNNLHSKIGQARENLLRAKERTKEIYDRKIIKRTPNYQIGDMVYLINQTDYKNKLSPEYLGPFCIYDILSDHNVIIQRKGRLNTVHVDNIKLAHFSPQEFHHATTDPVPGPSNLP
jgi:Integrase core domain.